MAAAEGFSVSILHSSPSGGSDFDHIRAEVGQDCRRAGTGDEAREGPRLLVLMNIFRLDMMFYLLSDF